jgi:hypothetical protein
MDLPPRARQRVQTLVIDHLVFMVSPVPQPTACCRVEMQHAFLETGSADVVAAASLGGRSPPLNLAGAAITVV